MSTSVFITTHKSPDFFLRIEKRKIGGTLPKWVFGRILTDTELNFNKVLVVTRCSCIHKLIRLVTGRNGPCSILTRCYPVIAVVDEIEPLPSTFNRQVVCEIARAAGSECTFYSIKNNHRYGCSTIRCFHFDPAFFKSNHRASFCTEQNSKDLSTRFFCVESIGFVGNRAKGVFYFSLYSIRSRATLNRHRLPPPSLRRPSCPFSSIALP